MIPPITKAVLFIAVTFLATVDIFAFTNAAYGIFGQPLTRQKSSSIKSEMSDKFQQERPEQTQARIKDLVDSNPVLLFMKGSKVFPQCGFSNTACQILQSYNIDFETVDVLADEMIRQGVKEFSQWPTIPQLYVAGEFIGGSDIMIEMYQNGELAEMIEKARADMI